MALLRASSGGESEEEEEEEMVRLARRSGAEEEDLLAGVLVSVWKGALGREEGRKVVFVVCDEEEDVPWYMRSDWRCSDFEGDHGWWKVSVAWDMMVAWYRLTAQVDNCGILTMLRQVRGRFVIGLLL
jgi:hypothetical protein